MDFILLPQSCFLAFGQSKDIGGELVYQPSKELYSVERNIAHSKPTYQTSDDCGGYSFRAVDGEKNGIYEYGGVVSTKRENNPTWYLDLTDNYNISEIHIYNRLYYKPERLKGAFVYLGTSTHKGIRWTNVQKLEGEYFTRIKVSEKNSKKVRYVKILNPGIDKTLSFAEVEVFGSFESKNSGENIAYGKKVFRSSELRGLELSKITDGNTDYRLMGRSIGQTTLQKNPYVSIDLEGTYDIERIDIFNRGDEGKDLIKGSSLYLETSYNGTNRKLLGKLSSEMIQSFEVKNLSISKNVRFISFKHFGMNKAISLSEIKVYGKKSEKTLKNIAIGKPTFQSSDYEMETKSDKAIDGKEDGFYENRGISCTKESESPFWFIDMENSYKVSLIEVYNRKDCCQTSLKGAKVFIGNAGTSENGIEWKEVGVLRDIFYNAIELNYEKKAEDIQYIKIQKIGKSHMLTLSEVKIYGVLNSDEEKCNLALGKPTTHSSSKGDPSKAVDGNTNVYLEGNSISETGVQEDPYWGVDLQGSYDISRIEVYNRAEGKGYLLEGAILYIGKLKNDKYVYKKVAVLDESTVQAFDLSKQPDCKNVQTIKIVNKGKNKEVNIAEVKIFSR
ncbi:fucolectin-related protein [Elysia marginata]|uniref:Fucolectin-related protein n=1 Tax=Elysia marginata TaxID=1093978 RepID=A0AAV4F0D4_9GAST|nr:fucolectin-related protein [Elysia marginata]